MISLNQNESKSPSLNHVTRERPRNPVKRTPSKTFLKSSFNENDFNTSSNTETKGATMNKKPGPPVSKKPEILKKPEVAKKPLALPSNNFGNGTSLSFRDNLNRKLAFPTTIKQPQENVGPQRNGMVPSQNKSQPNKVSSIARDLENALNKKNVDNPKSDRTLSLTEVSTLKTEEQSTKFMINDTLEMMTDEGFDTTTEDQINFNGDLDLSPDEDDDELFANFTIPPPPPPAVDFSDSEWDDSLQVCVKYINKIVIEIYTLFFYF